MLQREERIFSLNLKFEIRSNKFQFENIFNWFKYFVFVSVCIHIVSLSCKVGYQLDDSHMSKSKTRKLELLNLLVTMLHNSIYKIKGSVGKSAVAGFSYFPIYGWWIIL